MATAAEERSSRCHELSTRGASALRISRGVVLGLLMNPERRGLEALADELDELDRFLLYWKL
jgi:hypothetical protein